MQQRRSVNVFIWEKTSVIGRANQIHRLKQFTEVAFIQPFCHAVTKETIIMHPPTARSALLLGLPTTTCFRPKERMSPRGRAA